MSLQNVSFLSKKPLSLSIVKILVGFFQRVWPFSTCLAVLNVFGHFQTCPNMLKHVSSVATTSNVCSSSLSSEKILRHAFKHVSNVRKTFPTTHPSLSFSPTRHAYSTEDRGRGLARAWPHSPPPPREENTGASSHTTQSSFSLSQAKVDDARNV